MNSEHLILVDNAKNIELLSEGINHKFARQMDLNYGYQFVTLNEHFTVKHPAVKLSTSEVDSLKYMMRLQESFAIQNMLEENGFGTPEVKALFEQYNMYLDELNEGMFDRIKSVGHSAMQKAKSATATVAAKTKAMAKAVAGTLGDLASKLGGEVVKLFKEFEKMISSIGNSIKDLINGVLGFLCKLGDCAQEALGKMGLFKICTAESLPDSCKGVKNEMLSTLLEHSHVQESSVPTMQFIMAALKSIIDGKDCEKDAEELNEAENPNSGELQQDNAGQDAAAQDDYQMEDDIDDGSEDYGAEDNDQAFQKVHRNFLDKIEDWSKRHRVISRIWGITFKDEQNAKGWAKWKWVLFRIVVFGIIGIFMSTLITTVIGAGGIWWFIGLGIAAIWTCKGLMTMMFNRRNTKDPGEKYWSTSFIIMFTVSIISSVFSFLAVTKYADKVSEYIIKPLLQKLGCYDKLVEIQNFMREHGGEALKETVETFKKTIKLPTEGSGLSNNLAHSGTGSLADANTYHSYIAGLASQFKNSVTGKQFASVCNKLYKETLGSNAWGGIKHFYENAANQIDGGLNTTIAAFDCIKHGNGPSLVPAIVKEAQEILKREGINCHLSVSDMAIQAANAANNNVGIAHAVVAEGMASTSDNMSALQDALLQAAAHHGVGGDSCMTAGMTKTVQTVMTVTKTIRELPVFSFFLPIFGNCKAKNGTLIEFLDAELPTVEPTPAPEDQGSSDAEADGGALVPVVIPTDETPKPEETPVEDTEAITDVVPVPDNGGELMVITPPAVTVPTVITKPDPKPTDITKFFDDYAIYKHVDFIDGKDIEGLKDMDGIEEFKFFRFMNNGDPNRIIVFHDNAILGIITPDGNVKITKDGEKPQLLLLTTHQDNGTTYIACIRKDLDDYIHGDGDRTEITANVHESSTIAQLFGFGKKKKQNDGSDAEEAKLNPNLYRITEFREMTYKEIANEKAGGLNELIKQEQDARKEKREQLKNAIAAYNKAAQKFNAQKTDDNNAQVKKQKEELDELKKSLSNDSKFFGTNIGTQKVLVIFGTKEQPTEEERQAMKKDKKLREPKPLMIWNPNTGVFVDVADCPAAKQKPYYMKGSNKFTSIRAAREERQDGVDEYLGQLVSYTAKSIVMRADNQFGEGSYFEADGKDNVKLTELGHKHANETLIKFSSFDALELMDAWNNTKGSEKYLKSEPVAFNSQDFSNSLKQNLADDDAKESEENEKTEQFISRKKHVFESHRKKYADIYKLIYD